MVPEDAYTLQFVAPRVRAAAWRSVHLNVYTGKPRIEDLDLLAQAQVQMRERLGAGQLGVFGLAEGGIEFPDAEVRRYGSKLQSEMSPYIYASATAMSGAGFWLSAAISMVNTMTLLARPPTPARVFSDLEDASVWLSGFGAKEDAAQLQAQLLRLRDEPAVPE